MVTCHRKCAYSLIAYIMCIHQYLYSSAECKKFNARETQTSYALLLSDERSTLYKMCDIYFFHSIACEHHNGPNCYIFVVGMSAEVIKELAAIKLPVNVLINVHVKVNDTTGKLSRTQLRRL